MTAVRLTPEDVEAVFKREPCLHADDIWHLVPCGRDKPAPDRLTVLSVDRPVEGTLYIEVGRMIAPGECFPPPCRCSHPWVERVGEVQVVECIPKGPCLSAAVDGYRLVIASPVLYAEPVADRECPNDFCDSLEQRERNETCWACNGLRRVPLQLYPIGEVHE